MRKRVLLLIIACCHMALSYAAAAKVADDDYREKVIAEGVLALNKLIWKNHQQTLEGRSAENKYVLVLDGNSKYIEQKNITFGNVIYDPILSPGLEDTINKQLQVINTTDDFGAYILIFNSWVIDLKKEIPENATLSDVVAMQPYTNEDLRKKVWDQMDGIGEQIMFRSELSRFANRFGIVYGREICYLGKDVHKLFATTNTYAGGLGEGVLNSINNSLKGKLPAVSDTRGYLTTFPQALYNAYLREKDVRGDIELQYKFKPLPQSYFYNLQQGLGNEKCNNCPAPNDANNLVFDYSNILTPAQKDKMLKRLEFVTRESKYYKTKLYITDYQNPTPVLTAVQDYLKEPGDMDIILWVHLNKKGEVEMQTAYGKKVPNLGFANKFVKHLAAMMPDLPPLQFDPLTAMLDGLATVISAAEIPERFYNPEHIDAVTGESDYNATMYWVFTVTNITGLSLDLQMAITAPDAYKFKPTQLEFAVVCGFWNGLVRMLAGLPAFTSWGIKMILNEDDARSKFVDGMNKMFEQCRQNHVEISIPLPAFQMAGYTMCAWDGIKHHFTTGNACVIAAKTGSVIFDIVAVVVAFTKVGKLAQIAELMEMLDPINLMMKGAGTVINTVLLPTGKLAYRFGRGAITAIAREGKYYLRVFNETLAAIDDIDWNKVISWAEMATPDGRKLRVGVMMDPSELRNAHLRIKQVITDARGNEFIDGSGRRLCVIGDEAGDASNSLGIIDNTGGSGSTTPDPNANPGSGAGASAIAIVDELTPATMDHMYGEIEIKIYQMPARQPLLEEYSYVPGRGGRQINPKIEQATAEVTGCHLYRLVDEGLIEIVPGSKTLVGRLPTGEEVYIGRVKFKVTEMEKGGTGFKTKGDISTFWPEEWTEQKVKEVISQAFNNKTHVSSNLWRGITPDGIEVSIFLKPDGTISTAFPYFEKAAVDAAKARMRAGVAAAAASPAVPVPSVP